MLEKEFRDYTIISEIGRGGMGVVYQAKHKILGQEFALKVIHDRLLVADESAAKARFVQEATLMAALNHPNIVTLQNCFEEHGKLVIASELLRGNPMHDILMRDSIPPIGVRINWLRQLLAGLSHAHEQGVIHRDLKPSNLFVTDDNQVKILDFGLGKDLSSDAQMTGTGQILGTPAYLPPETYRIENKVPIRDVGKKGDVFAVGVIAYRLLGGRLPFDLDDGLSANEVFTLLAVNYNTGKTIAPLTVDDAVVSSAVLNAVMDCLTVSPNNRPESLKPLAAALASEAAGAPPPSENSSARPPADQSLTGCDTYFEVSRTGGESPLVTTPEVSAPRTNQPKKRQILLGMALAVVLATVAAGIGIFFVSHQATMESPKKGNLAVAASIKKDTDAIVEVATEADDVAKTTKTIPEETPDSSAAINNEAPLQPEKQNHQSAPPIQKQRRTKETSNSDNLSKNELLRNADRKYRRGKAEEAIALFNKVLEKEPGNIEALNGLGHTHLQMNAYGVAISKFKRALSQNPSFGPSMIGMAQVYKQMGRRPEAIKWFEKYLNSNSNRPHADLARRNIAELKLQAQKTEEATSAPGAGAESPY